MAEVREHPETFHDAARGFAKTLGARAVYLFDPSGSLLARSDREPGEETGRDFTALGGSRPARRVRSSGVSRSRLAPWPHPVTQEAAETPSRRARRVLRNLRRTREEMALLPRGRAVGNVARGARYFGCSLPPGSSRSPCPAMTRAVTVFSQEPTEPVEFVKAARPSLPPPCPSARAVETIAALVVGRSKERRLSTDRQPLVGGARPHSSPCLSHGPRPGWPPFRNWPRARDRSRAGI
jgi:hypothetical protein